MTQEGEASDEDGRCGGRRGERRVRRRTWGVGSIDWGRGHSVFSVDSHIWFVAGSAGLNRPVAARRRNVMSLYYLRRRESVFRRGKTKFFGEPSQAIASQGDIARLF